MLMEKIQLFWVHIPWLLQGFSTIQTVVGLGISEPSTESFAKLTN